MATTGQGEQQSPPATNPLSQYVLDGVEDLDEVIGHGSYAVVKKLRYRGLTCVGKKMHDILYLNATAQQREDMLSRFEGECELLSRLHHPCIVQFMGVYFEEGTPLPILVMEFLHSTLAATIDRFGVLPDQISYWILCGVSLGLRCLHEHSPPIIHRDLSANNVLLTPDMSAKLSDLGVAKILNLTPAQITQLVQTKAPGTPCYMPPEALVSRPMYDTKIDIYSIGVLMIHVFCGEWPFPSDVFRPDPHNPASLIPMTEVERRAKYLGKIGDDHPLTPLMCRCLNNNSTVCPDVDVIHTQLAEVQAHLPAMAETRVEWFRQLQSAQDEVLAVRKSLQENIDALKVQLEHVSLLQVQQSAELSKGSEPSEEVHLLHPQSKLQWKRCANMPVEAKKAQAVIIEDEVYVGGGLAENGHDRYLVSKYNQAEDKWVCLPDHLVVYFGLCEFQGNLITVGGLSDGVATNMMYQYNKEDKVWVDSLKPMHTARAYLSVLTTPSAIIACGGLTVTARGKPVVVVTVEVYSSRTAQWSIADPLPQPRWAMSSVKISGGGYFLGGLDANDQSVRSCFHLDMAMLVDRATTFSKHPVASSSWKTLPSIPLMGSAAAAISGSLLAVGGLDDKHTKCSAVYLFIPFANTWMKLPSGNIPAERSSSTAVQLSNNRVLVIGGRGRDKKYTSTCFIGSIVIL